MGIYVGLIEYVVKKWYIISKKALKAIKNI